MQPYQMTRWHTNSFSCPRCGSWRMRRSASQSALETLKKKCVMIRPYRCENCNERVFRFSPWLAVKSFVTQRWWAKIVARRLRAEQREKQRIMEHAQKDEHIANRQGRLQWRALREWLANQCQELARKTGAEILVFESTRDSCQAVICHVRTGRELKVTYEQPDETHFPSISYGLAGDPAAAERVVFRLATETTLVLQAVDGRQYSIRGFGVMLLSLILAAESAAKSFLSPQRNGAQASAETQVDLPDIPEQVAVPSFNKSRRSNHRFESETSG